MFMKRVLIVEDQADIRELIRMTLELEDLDIRESETGDAGLVVAQQWRPDLVLLDVMMPGVLDGFDVCRAVKADPALVQVKVVMLTARMQDSDRQAGLGAGADGYLTKPFSPRQLLGMVHQLLA
jgi:DNA-binding response OmpR family regulator